MTITFIFHSVHKYTRISSITYRSILVLLPQLVIKLNPNNLYTLTTYSRFS